MNSTAIRKIPAHAFGEKSVIRIRNIENVLHNFNLYREKASMHNAECAPVLKGDVHGLGLKDVAPALYHHGVRTFFMEEIIEAISLRKILEGQYAPLSDSLKIYALAGLVPGEEPYFFDHIITPCVNGIEQLENWNNYCAGKEKRSVAIHLDAHMNRIGFLDDQVDLLAKNYASLTSNIDVALYMSHLFDIKGDDQTNCYMQLNVLKGYLAKLPPAPVSFVCTDGFILLNREEFVFNQIRIGVGLVGGSPNSRSLLDPDIKHCLEIYAKISQPKIVKKGHTIGYGGAYTCTRDTKIVIAHIGYKDGYLRVLSKTDKSPDGSSGFMSIGGYMAPIVGKISLGMTTLDVTDIPERVLNDCAYAEVVGPNVDIRKLADIVGCYEILVALGRPNLKFADFTEKEFVTRCQTR